MSSARVVGQAPQVDVVVVGLGPVGDVLAALLGRAGLRVLAVERDLDVYPLPRAAVFDDEIMRTFQQLGIASEILPHTRNWGADVDDDGTMAAWLDRHEAAAVLVRPDRYVFGTGSPGALVLQLRRAMTAPYTATLREVENS